MTHSPQQSPRHIAIVGGGIIGAATLHALAHSPRRNGAKLTMIEASFLIAPGASSKAGGFLASDWHEKPTSSLGHLSFQLHKQLAAAHSGAQQWGYRSLDTYFGAFDKQNAGSEPQPHPQLKWVDASGLSGEPLEQTGTTSTTAQVVPGDLAHFLTDHAASTGNVDFMLGTSLTHINTDDRGKVLSLDLSILSEAQTLAITDLVICTGPWTSSVLHHTLDTDSPLRQLPFFDAAAEVKGSRAHSVIVRGLDIGPHALFTTTTYRGPRGCTKEGSPEFYCRPDDTTYICGDTDGEDLPAMVDEVEPSERQISRLLEQAGSIAPALLDKGTKILARQACFLPMSKNSGRPILRFDSATGFGVAAGHSCWGITLSLGTGQVMAELILEGQARSADISLLGGLHEGSSEEEEAAAPTTAAAADPAAGTTAPKEAKPPVQSATKRG